MPVKKTVVKKKQIKKTVRKPATGIKKGKGIMENYKNRVFNDILNEPMFINEIGKNNLNLVVNSARDRVDTLPNFKDAKKFILGSGVLSQQHKDANKLFFGENNFLNNKLDNATFSDFDRARKLLGINLKGSGLLSSLNDALYNTDKKNTSPNVVSRLASNMSLSDMLTIGEILKKNS